MAHPIILRNINGPAARRIARDFSIPCLLKYEDLIKQYPTLLIRKIDLPESILEFLTSLLENKPSFQANKEVRRGSAKTRPKSTSKSTCAGKQDNVIFTEINHVRPTRNNGTKRLNETKKPVTGRSGYLSNTELASVNYSLQPKSSRRAPDEDRTNSDTSHNRSSRMKNRSELSETLPPTKRKRVHNGSLTSDVVDETIVYFLPELVQKSRLVSNAKNPKELCRKFSLTLSDLGLDNKLPTE